MIVHPTAIPDVVILEPRLFRDDRGYFFESFSQQEFNTRGCVLDVAVDIRQGSPTFGQHVAVELRENNHLQLFIPRGFAHGFAVLSEEAVFQYKCDNYYAPESDAGISLLDERLDIDWRIPVTEAILSAKDQRHPLLADAPHDFIWGEELY